MNIVICASMKFSKEMVDLKQQLTKKGHHITLPKHAVQYASGELKSESSIESTQNKIEQDLIRDYFKKIKYADAVIIANYDKDGIKGYIGGNSFLEMGFAHVLDKKIFLLYDIPDMIFTDELRAMQPEILDQNLSQLD